MAVIGNLKKGVNLERTIEDMEVGESGFTLPWALSFDLEKKPYLNLEYPISTEPLGTSALPVTRFGPGPSDYDVDISNLVYKWSIIRDPQSVYVGVDKSKVVPLATEEKMGSIN